MHSPLNTFTHIHARVNKFRFGSLAPSGDRFAQTCTLYVYIYTPIPQLVYTYLYLYFHFAKTDSTCLYIFVCIFTFSTTRFGSLAPSGEHFAQALSSFVRERSALWHEESGVSCPASRYTLCVAVYCSMLQVCCKCVASVLQCGAVCCSVVRCVAERSVFWHEESGVACPELWYTLCVAVYCSVLECVAAHCVASVRQVCCKCVANVLQMCCKCVASVLQMCCKCVASVLQCVASVLQVCCSVLQVCCKCVAVCSALWHKESGVSFLLYCTCCVLQCTAVCVALCCSMLQCVAVCYNVLQVYCNLLQACCNCVVSILQNAQRFGTRSQGSFVLLYGTRCVLQCTAVSCSVLQCVASVLQVCCKCVASVLQVCCSVFSALARGVRCRLSCFTVHAVCCSVVVCCSVLGYAAMRCSMLQMC